MAYKSYTCLIVDDEPLARELIEMHISILPFLTIAGNCSSAIEAAQWLKENSADILLLDIKMPHLSGIEFLQSHIIKSKVIITTAYSEFALNGFDMDVIDYLLKPITFERFNVAINKVIERIDLEDSAIENTEKKGLPATIVVRSSHQIFRIEIDDIIYIEGLHKYIKIVTTHKKYTTIYTMHAMKSELPSAFFRCHRSFIVNLNKVDYLDGNELVCGSFKIPVSKSNRNELIKKIGKQLGN